MEVKELKPAEAGSLLGDAATVVTSEAWLKTFAQDVRAYGVFNGHEARAIFALQHTRRYGLARWTNAALSPHCGLVLLEPAGKAARLNGCRKDIMAAIAHFLDQPKWAVISVIFPDWIRDFQPFVWRGFKVLVRYTYQIQLTGKSDEELLRDMNPTRRNEIRNGHKKDLSVEACADPSIVEIMTRKTFMRQGVTGDSEHIRILLREFAEPSNSFGYVVLRGTVPVAVCFCVYDKERAYYVLGGVDHEQRAAPAAPMALFNCIRHARDLGLKMFDFEGSMVPGIEKYFRSFGGVLTPIYRVVKASLPIELCLKPFKRSLF